MMDDRLAKQKTEVERLFVEKVSGKGIIADTNKAKVEMEEEVKTLLDDDRDKSL